MAGRPWSDKVGRAAPPRKRRRIVISCTECHRRKQKCDRGLPCANCVSRDIASACVYDKCAPTMMSQRGEDVQQSMPTAVRTQAPFGLPEPGYLSAKAADWGYAHNGASTMGLLKRIEAIEHGQDSAIDADRGEPAMRADDSLVREKFRSLIRQLPTKIYVDKLIELYMRNVNWQYFPIEPDVFKKQLQEWNEIPFKVFSTVGPRGLPLDLRAFPALLFQVLAIGLVLLPEEPDPVFDALKYAGSMKFEDLAVDYSDSGAAILDLIGKKHLSLTSVQALFMRAAFNKYVARVTEAWHTISVAIRDAQELGMHSDHLDPKPKDSSTESILENEWNIQRRRKMYNLLAVWDINIASILGRPGTIDWSRPLPTAPIDTLLQQDRLKTPVIARRKDDPPTSLTRLLWTLELAGPLRAIQDLEREGHCPKDFEKVNQLQERIQVLDKRMHPSFRLENPDTTWDDDADLHWIGAARLYFAQLHEFSLMALHRPYVFHRKESRTEAIHASLRMLEIQGLAYTGLPADSWRNFLLFFGPFDAIVLLACIFILFPHEHRELAGKVRQHFEWSLERFLAMQTRNPLARSAQGVLRAVVVRFDRAIQKHQQASDCSPSDSDVTLSKGPSTVATVSEDPEPGLTVNSLQSSTTSTTNIDWAPPSVDSLATIAPLFPTSDLIYNDLSALPTDEARVSVHQEEPQQSMDDFALQFGGAWEDDSVWQMLNQYLQPAVGGALA